MKRYPQEVSDFIEKNVKGTTTKELIELVNTIFGTHFTESKMKSYKTNHKLKSGTQLGLPKGRPTELYPKKIREFIEAKYHGVGHKVMAEMLNKTFKRNYTQAQMKAYYARCKLDSGLSGQFPKGHVPVRAIQKGQHLSMGTEFKKGQSPVNYRPIGSERINVEDYIEIKVADLRTWTYKHIFVWEQYNGPVPKGHVIIFGDGDRRNFDINNLLLVFRKQLLTLNQKGLIQKDADLTRSAIVITDIFHKIHEKTKQCNM